MSTGAKEELSEKKGQILEAAESLFSEKGFDGSSVRDIAEKAGVNVAMISYYFGSKEKLMQSIFERRNEHFKMQVESLLRDEQLSYTDKVFKLIDDHIERAFSRASFYKLMICEQVINKNPAVIGIMKDMKKRNMAVISALIHAGQDAGVFRRDINIMMLFTSMFGTVSQSIIGADLYREINGLQHISEEAFQARLKADLGVHLKNYFKAILTHEV